MSDLPPFASFTDVQGIWRTLTSAEIDVVENRIDQASNLIRDQVPLVGGLTVDERIDAGKLRWETVRDIVVEMVERVVTIPRYARQSMVTVDDGSVSNTFDTTVSSGEMFLSDAQLDRLLGRTQKRRRAFTIVPA